jgi:hypothetical protein
MANFLKNFDRSQYSGHSSKAEMAKACYRGYFDTSHYTSNHKCTFYIRLQLLFSCAIEECNNESEDGDSQTSTSQAAQDYACFE